MGRAWLALSAFVALQACGRSDTGLEVSFHVGSLAYDELQLRITGSSSDPDGGASNVLVDPGNKGRFLGPFANGDQSVVVLVSDALAGAAVRCEASALSGGAPVAAGSADAIIERDAIKRVEIVMTTPGAQPPPTGTGGTGAPPPPGNANGQTCSVGMECLSGHCSDGVCCEEECNKGCRSCALPDTKGLCRPVAEGTPDPRGMCNDKGASSCQTNGLCGVAGDCAVYPAGTECAPADCADTDKFVVPARTCDGAGRCQDSMMMKMKCPEPSRCAGGICG